MNKDFLASLDKLIGDEAARLAAQQAENDRLTEEGRQDKERVEGLQPKIAAKLGEISTIWSECLEAVQKKSGELGFVADISGHRDGEWHTLQVNFHLHAGGIAPPLKLTVTQRGQGQFDPNRSTAFDFLQAGPGVFTGNLLAHVTDLFHMLGDKR